MISLRKRGVSPVVSNIIRAIIGLLVIGVMINIITGDITLNPFKALMATSKELKEAAGQWEKDYVPYVEGQDPDDRTALYSMNALACALNTVASGEEQACMQEFSARDTEDASAVEEVVGGETEEKPEEKQKVFLINSVSELGNLIKNCKNKFDSVLDSSTMFNAYKDDSIFCGEIKLTDKEKVNEKELILWAQQNGLATVFKSGKEGTETYIKQYYVEQGAFDSETMLVCGDDGVTGNNIYLSPIEGSCKEIKEKFWGVSAITVEEAKKPSIECGDEYFRQHEGEIDPRVYTENIKENDVLVLSMDYRVIDEIISCWEKFKRTENHNEKFTPDNNNNVHCAEIIANSNNLKVECSTLKRLLVETAPVEKKVVAREAAGKLKCKNTGGKINMGDSFFICVNNGAKVNELQKLVLTNNRDKDCPIAKQQTSRYGCSVQGFELPQEIPEISIADNWLSGLGDPKYLLYYEAFPEGEDASWKVDMTSWYSPVMFLSAATTFIMGPNKFVENIAKKAARKKLAKAVIKHAAGEMGEEAYEKAVKSFIFVYGDETIEGMGKKMLVRKEALLGLGGVVTEQNADDYLIMLSKYLKGGTVNNYGAMYQASRGFFRRVLDGVTEGSELFTELNWYVRVLSDEAKDEVSEIAAKQMGKKAFAEATEEQIQKAFNKAMYERAKIKFAEALATQSKDLVSDIVKTATKEQIESVIKQTSFKQIYSHMVRLGGLDKELMGEWVEQEAKRLAKLNSMGLTKDQLKKVMENGVKSAEAFANSAEGIKIAEDVLTSNPKHIFNQITAKATALSETVGAVGEKAYGAVSKIPFNPGGLTSIASGTAKLTGKTVKAGASLSKFVNNHRIFTIVGLGIISSRQDSMNEKWKPQGKNTLYLNTPSMLQGNDLGLELSSDVDNSFIEIDLDGEARQRIFLVSPCKSDVYVTRASTKCYAPRNVNNYDIYDFGTGFMPVKKNTLTYPELRKFANEGVDSLCPTSTDAKDYNEEDDFTQDQICDGKTIGAHLSEYDSQCGVGKKASCVFGKHFCDLACVPHTTDEIEEAEKIITDAEDLSNKYNQTLKAKAPDYNLANEALILYQKVVDSYLTQPYIPEEMRTFTDRAKEGIIRILATAEDLPALYKIVGLDKKPPLSDTGFFPLSMVFRISEDLASTDFFDVKITKDERQMRETSLTKYYNINMMAWDFSTLVNDYNEIDETKARDKFFNLITHEFGFDKRYKSWDWNRDNKAAYFVDAFIDYSRSDCRNALYLISQIPALSEYNTYNFETKKEFIAHKGFPYSTACTWGLAPIPTFMFKEQGQFLNTYRSTMVKLPEFNEMTKVMDDIEAKDYLRRNQDDNIIEDDFKKLYLTKHYYETKSYITQGGYKDTSFSKEDFKEWEKISKQIQKLGDGNYVDATNAVKICQEYDWTWKEIPIIGSGDSAAIFWENEYYTPTSLHVEGDITLYKDYNGGYNYCYTRQYKAKTAAKYALMFGGFIAETAAGAGAAYFTAGNPLAIRTAMAASDFAMGILGKVLEDSRKWPRNS